jgi:phosphoenolpyruvate carboxylase
LRLFLPPPQYNTAPLPPIGLSQDETPIRDDVRLLGNILGETLISQEGRTLFDLVERVRAVAKSARLGNEYDGKTLSTLLAELSVDQVFHLARAFSHFLSLANIAEQHHQARCNRSVRGGAFSVVLTGLLDRGLTQQSITDVVGRMNINLVLTAHPTEITRRTMTQKFHRIANLLHQKDAPDITNRERDAVVAGLRREVLAIWETDEIRRQRPTPLDEVRSGLTVIEQSIWKILPDMLRELDDALLQHTGQRLEPDAAPLRIDSWIGGDRDGNPNVTPQVTYKACLMARSLAADLYWQEVSELRRELSMTRSNTRVREQAGGAHEPYRELMAQLGERLAATHRLLEAELNDRPHGDEPIIECTADIHKPLWDCYQSLHECGMGELAEGRLLDLMRRLSCFGLGLVRLDLRQEASRHSEALDAITEHLGMGTYTDWDEPRRQQFLITELDGRRPLIPVGLAASDEVHEVLDTFKMIRDIPADCLGAYIISMASQPSDVLAVELLQRECGVRRPLRVAPLFERVEHLSGAADTISALFDHGWYRRHSRSRQEVMIGYSDSAKDAGQFAAAWGLYQAQEQLTAIAAQKGIELTLFHGRGGTVARGGIPAMDAIRSLPPASVDGRLRITEQGEVVQAKFGLPDIAYETLGTYVSSVLETTLLPPAAPKPEWRDAMNRMCEVSMQSYRQLVHQDPGFLDYFSVATPVAELGKLNIGSRPARRKPGRDIAHLRAIPWIFAWTQTRLMLPAWLGTGYGLRVISDNDISVLHRMRRDWPFFAATLDAIEMVLAKTDVNVAAQYDKRLVPVELSAYGEELRSRYTRVYSALLKVTEHGSPLEHEPVTQRSIRVRNPYTDPLNLLQAELLARMRNGGNGHIQDALLITVNGIAAGMRNTG